jgi:hypothetical protein
VFIDDCQLIHAFRQPELCEIPYLDIYSLAYGTADDWEAPTPSMSQNTGLGERGLWVAAERYQEDRDSVLQRRAMHAQCELFNQLGTLCFMAKAVSTRSVSLPLYGQGWRWQVLSS